MPLEGNRNPNNVIRMEYEVRLLGHDCDYKANSSFLLSTTIINFSAIGKLFKDGAGLRRNQLAKLRRWYTVWKNTVLEKYTLENRNLKAVGHSFQKIYHVPRTLCYTDTVDIWKCDLPTHLLTGVGSRDARASKNIKPQVKVSSEGQGAWVDIELI